MQPLAGAPVKTKGLSLQVWRGFPDEGDVVVAGVSTRQKDCVTRFFHSFIHSSINKS